MAFTSKVVAEHGGGEDGHGASSEAEPGPQWRTTPPRDLGGDTGGGVWEVEGGGVPTWCLTGHVTWGPAKALSAPQCPHLRSGSTNAFYDPRNETNYVNREKGIGGAGRARGLVSWPPGTALVRKGKCGRLVTGGQARSSTRRVEAACGPLSPAHDPEARRPLCPECPGFRLPVTALCAQRLTGKRAF